jgi:O-succinylbenzoate synthase
LSYVRPKYIILKPALCGGLADADKWIETAEHLNIGWWATSALESNVGLNAIAQWVSAKRTTMHQGLGTGELYHNNIVSPIVRKGSKLFYNPNANKATIDFN